MTYTKEQARIEVANLVDRFKKNEASLNMQAEAQIENDYIRPLFEHLNWNTTNRGLSVSEYEFVLQKTDRHGKRPDYILQLDGQHLLVMDAKQVKYDMHDPRWINQVYAYAYSTQNLSLTRKIDFAVLTDFQEYVVLDCTLYASNPKVISNFRVLDWRCDDYVTQFDTLWELFERENLRKAAATRGTDKPQGLWARYLSPKKVKANRIPPDKAFLAEMDNDKTGWRVRLAEDMKKHNPEAEGAEITAAVQLLIDRLIFIKSLSDREIDEDYLAQLASTIERAGLNESDTNWFKACRSIFKKLNQFYDGNIFESRPEENIIVSNKVVRSILRELHLENSPYNFAVMPVEILGTIYERFLGRVVRTTEQRVKIEDKPEVRKAGGVYYTPQYIVDYIVENTVGKLLAKCKSPADVAKLTILDPSCGSGSFLIGVCSALIQWYIDYYAHRHDRSSTQTRRDRDAYYLDSDGRVRLTAKLKRQILLDNIHGVDIDSQAVEVTRFSLSLKALENIRRNELYEEVDLFRQAVLPDLSRNIKCGNSLVGNDYSLHPTDRYAVNAFDWQNEFPEVMESYGFDVVIGNPPYIAFQEGREELKRYYKRKYQAATGKYDQYILFVERALSILKKDGFFGFILPNKFIHSNYGGGIKKVMLQHQIVGIADFTDLAVFADATNYPCIVIIRKSKGNKKFAYKSVQSIDGGEIKFSTVQIKQTGLTSSAWLLIDNKEQDTLYKLHHGTIPLGAFSYAITQGLRTGQLRVFYNNITPASIASNKIESALLREVYHGKNVKRYSSLLNKERDLILFPYEKDNRTAVQINKYPHARRYLTQFREGLNERKDSGKLFKNTEKGWFEYWDPKPACFKSPKIVFPDISKRNNFYLDIGGVGYLNTCYAIFLKDSVDPRYVLGILNSSASQFFIRKICPSVRGGFYRYKTQYVKQIPIRTINMAVPAEKEHHDRMVQMVESMLMLHQHKDIATTRTEQDQVQRQINVTDRQIDQLVYELYDLTPKEIKIVEAQQHAKA